MVPALRTQLLARRLLVGGGQPQPQRRALRLRALPARVRLGGEHVRALRVRMRGAEQALEGERAREHGHHPAAQPLEVGRHVHRHWVERLRLRLGVRLALLAAVAAALLPRVRGRGGGGGRGRGWLGGGLPLRLARAARPRPTRSTADRPSVRGAARRVAVRHTRRQLGAGACG